MNVDGSLVAVNYSVVPDTSKNEFLESISITLHDPGNSKVGDFGSELALINGLQLQYQSNGTLSQLINIKTNSDLITYADELKDSDGLAGSSIITYTVYFSEAIVLKNSSSDFVRIIIQDDVTGISHLIAKAKLRRIVS